MQQEQEAVCPVEFALDQQRLRNDVGEHIKSRRTALKLSSDRFAEMIDCSGKDLQRMEEGMLFFQMPFIRMSALLLLGKLEAREVGRRRGDAPHLRLVSG